MDLPGQDAPPGRCRAKVKTQLVEHVGFT